VGRFVVPLALFAAWWAATASGAIKSYQLASPRDVVRELFDLAQTGLLWRDLGASIERVALGSRSRWASRWSSARWSADRASPNARSTDAASDPRRSVAGVGAADSAGGWGSASRPR